jgi:hypothetical protein
VDVVVSGTLLLGGVVPPVVDTSPERVVTGGMVDETGPGSPVVVVQAAADTTMSVSSERFTDGSLRRLPS